MDHLTLASWPDLVIVNKKENLLIVDVVILSDHIVKLKESGKRDKYPDLAWELQKLWNMKVMVITIVIGMLITDTKTMGQEEKDLE